MVGTCFIRTLQTSGPGRWWGKRRRRSRRRCKRTRGRRRQRRASRASSGRRPRARSSPPPRQCCPRWRGYRTGPRTPAATSHLQRRFKERILKPSVRLQRRRRKGKPTARWGRKVTGLYELAGPPNRLPRACRIPAFPDGSSSRHGGEPNAWESAPAAASARTTARPFQGCPVLVCAQSTRARRVPHEVASGDREPSGGAPRPPPGGSAAAGLSVSSVSQADERIAQQLVDVTNVSRCRSHVRRPHTLQTVER